MNNEKVLKSIIFVICIIVPCLVAVLYFLPKDAKNYGLDTSFLPFLNALLNSATAFLLVLALWAVKVKKINLHRNLMLFCLALGAIFLVSYVVYHATTSSVIFGDLNHDGVRDITEKSVLGNYLPIYVFVLSTHIVFSMVVLPFVLFAVYFALMNKVEKHKKIVRFAYPVWMYISVTGVIVYFMISPYYE